MSHNDELSLALLNEFGHVVKTVLEDNWLSGLLGISATLLGLSLGLKTGLLFLLGLWLVLGEELKELTCYLQY